MFRALSSKQIQKAIAGGSTEDSWFGDVHIYEPVPGLTLSKLLYSPEKGRFGLWGENVASIFLSKTDGVSVLIRKRRNAISI